MNPYPPSFCIGDYIENTRRLSRLGNQTDLCEADEERVSFDPFGFARPDRMGLVIVYRSAEGNSAVASALTAITGMVAARGAEESNYEPTPFAGVLRADNLVSVSKALATANVLTVGEFGLSGTNRVIIGPDVALKAKIERRIRARDTSKKKEKFVPSYDLSRFVLLADELAPKEGRHASLTEAEALSRKEHIINSVFGLLQTIADSLERQGKRQYKVGSEGRFEDSFAKALLFRIQVAVYGQTPFLDALFGELSSSDAAANGWRLNSDELGSLVLDVDAATPNPQRIPRKRATPVRLKMTQFPED